MLSLGALGRNEAFEMARQRYEYHRQDEAAPSVASPYKKIHLMDNPEVQALREHELHVMHSPSGTPSGANSSASREDSIPVYGGPGAIKDLDRSV